MRSTRWTSRLGTAALAVACFVVVALVHAGEASATAGIWRPQDGPTFRFGSRGDWPLVGDWNGDDKDEPGVFRGNTFHLGAPILLPPSARTASFQFGRAGDMPIAGDWDGDGKDTVGVFRRGVFYLRNSNSAGPADEVVRFGLTTPALDTPLTGDWDGDGKDELAVSRWDSITVHVRGHGQVRWGRHGAHTFVGDWDGDGISTFASRSGEAYISNTTCIPTCPDTLRNHAVIPYGLDTDVSFGADFDGDGRDEVGIVEVPYPPPVRNPDHVECDWFQVQSEAQRYFDYWYPLYRWFFHGGMEADRHSELDTDRDFIACEHLPRP
jgi:hypothetical protein